MAQYQITRILTVENGGAIMADRLVGPGWADSASNVMNYVHSGMHAFYLEMAGKKVWLRTRTNARSGRPELVATDANGHALGLDQLPIDWSGERKAESRPEAGSWLQRIMAVGRR